MLDGVRFGWIYYLELTDHVANPRFSIIHTTFLLYVWIPMTLESYTARAGRVHHPLQIPSSESSKHLRPKLSESDEYPRGSPDWIQFILLTERLPSSSPHTVLTHFTVERPTIRLPNREAWEGPKPRILQVHKVLASSGMLELEILSTYVV